MVVDLPVHNVNDQKLKKSLRVVVENVTMVAYQRDNWLILSTGQLTSDRG